MDIKELEEYLGTEEGKSYLEEQKQPLVNKNAELLGKLDSIKKDIDALKQKEIDTAAEALTAKTAAERAKAEKDNDIDAYKKLHETELTSRDDKINTLKSNFAKAELSRLVSSTAAKHSNAPKPLELLLNNRMQTSYDDAGELQMQVLDEAGKPMVGASIESLVDALKSAEENAPFFNGTGSSGAGTTVTDTTSAVGKPAMGEDGYNLTEAMGNKLV